MKPTEILKQRWREASALVDQIDEERMELLRPTEKNWHAALDALQFVNDQCEAHDHLRCDGCEAPIFQDDAYSGGYSILCEECSPTYQELIEDHEAFVDGDGKPATPEQCREWFDAHIAAGGSPTDSMARVAR
ncbi:hypothetical protein I6F11_04240 [Ensifer sp. NBAIM29]|nr:hypothetical protein [Ensifer sp. NBAIM29]